MASAIQAPILRGKPERVGSRTFRKQILPIGRVAHPDFNLSFDRQLLEKYASNFHEGAYDQVPFVLVDDFNRHNDDPERFRGFVRDMTVERDGLYAVLEMTDRGAELIRDNPQLGVSPRLKPEPDPGASTPRKWPAIAHVAGTLFPRADGMKGWENFTDLSISQGVVAAELARGDRLGTRDLSSDERARREFIERWAREAGYG